MPQDKFANTEFVKLAPMIFGRIRWSRSIGTPLGDDPAVGFRVLLQEHTVSEFQDGPGGIRVKPGTGIWLRPVAVPCEVAPDEGDAHVVTYHAYDVHLTAFPDGKYQVLCELTDKWPRREKVLARLLGQRRIEPQFGYNFALTDKKHVKAFDFELVQTSPTIRDMFRPHSGLASPRP